MYYYEAYIYDFMHDNEFGVWVVNQNKFIFDETLRKNFIALYPSDTRTIFTSHKTPNKRSKISYDVNKTGITKDDILNPNPPGIGIFNMYIIKNNLHIQIISEIAQKFGPYMTSHFLSEFKCGILNLTPIALWLIEHVNLCGKKFPFKSNPKNLKFHPSCCRKTLKYLNPLYKKEKAESVCVKMCSNLWDIPNISYKEYIEHMDKFRGKTFNSLAGNGFLNHIFLFLYQNHIWENHFKNQIGFIGEIYMKNKYNTSDSHSVEKN